MNILCCNPNGGAFKYITQGWEDAFKALGHTFQRWNGTPQQIKQLKPDLYLGCSGWRQDYPNWAKTAYNTKIAIHVNPWGSNKIQRHPGEPDINEPEGAIQWVSKQKPDFLYCYAIEDDVKQYWNQWEQKLAPVIPMPTGGNAVAHSPVKPNPQFQCDIGFVGGYWPYKAINLNKYLVPILPKVKAQIYGWGGWSNPAYRGTIQDNQINQLFSSAKICPSIVEPHTSRTGIDIPERMFKIPLGGGFTILDPCKGIERYISTKVFPTAKNIKEYNDLIHHYLKHPEEREKLRKEQHKAILKDHTYFTRIQGFLRLSGRPEEAKKAQEKVEELLA